MDSSLELYIKKFDPDLPWVKLIANSIELSALCDKEWKFNVDQINHHLTNGTLILDCSTDPFNRHEESVVNELSSFTTDFIVLSGDINYLKNPLSHICYFPYWYLTQQEYLPLDANITINASRAYKLSCLNGRSRYHRIENYIKLKIQPYFKELLFVMHGNFDLELEKKEFTEQDAWSDECVAKFLKDIESFQRNYPNDHSIQHPAYTNSYINYVTETSVSSKILFFSEKTWKPIMSGQFGIWLGNPGTVNFLRSIGFDMFDDIIDHSYDNETNFRVRLELLHQSINQLMLKDLSQLFVQTEQRRIANQELFYSSKLQNLLTNQCNNYKNKITKFLVK